MRDRWGAALVLHQRVNFVYNEGAGVAQHFAATHTGQQVEQGLGGGHQDVGRVLYLPGTLALGGVSRPHSYFKVYIGQPIGFEAFADALQGLLQVALYVVAQRLEGRHIHHLGVGRQLPGQPFAVQLIEHGIESGQRLTRSGGCSYEGVAALQYLRPGVLLHGRRFTKGFGKPAGYGWVEVFEVVHACFSKLIFLSFFEERIW